jgi:hypothetical protein
MTVPAIDEVWISQKYGKLPALEKVTVALSPD